LGLCFGHQLLAAALGGDVGANPRGVELCTTTVTLTDAAQTDPLFAGLTPQLQVHAAHFHTVLQPPPGITVLASNDMDPHHAVRFAPNVWGVQFHPELEARIISAYQKALADRLPPDPGPATDTPPVGMDAGAVVLRRFAALVDDYASNRI
jgi:GMP synthase (glutamine-hydrolysing)